MKILIVNRFFGGAQIPTGRMAEDVARLLVEDGHEVSALASTGTYAGAEKRARDNGTEGIRDEETKRLKDEKTAEQRSEGAHARDQELKRPSDEERRPETGSVRVEEVRVPKWMPRALAWLWFTWQARRRIPQMDWDVCVLMTDPPLLPLLALSVAGVSRLKVEEPEQSGDSARHGRGQTKRPKDQDPKRRVAVWLMDLYPEALAASGRIGRNNPLYKWYFNKRQRALGAADLLICLGEAQRERLETERQPEVGGRRPQTGDGLQSNQLTKDQEQGQGAQLTERVRTAVVPPWDDRGNIAVATDFTLRNLALYAGNLGEAHCFEEILAASPHLPGDWTIRFAVRGAKLAALRAKARNLSHGLTRIDTDSFSGGDPAGKSSHRAEESLLGARVEVTGYASEEETPALLASARVHLITMSPGWDGIVVPSKLYGCIRTGRPVLFIGPENADTAREIRAHDWGLALPPGANGDEVAAAILELAARPTRAVQSENGAKKVAELIQGLATE